MTKAASFAVLAVLILLPQLSDAQGLRRGGGPSYDPKKEETVKAIAGETYTGPGGNTILAATVDGRPLHFILGPPEFVQKAKFTVTRGAKIEVAGNSGYRVNSQRRCSRVRSKQAGRR